MLTYANGVSCENRQSSLRSRGSKIEGYVADVEKKSQTVLIRLYGRLQVTVETIKEPSAIFS
jgi:hypothetical protein